MIPSLMPTARTELCFNPASLEVTLFLKEQNQEIIYLLKYIAWLL